MFYGKKHQEQNKHKQIDSKTQKKTERNTILLIP